MVSHGSAIISQKNIQKPTETMILSNELRKFQPQIVPLNQPLMIPEELCSREPNLVAYTVALQALQVAGPQWTVAPRRLAKQMGGAQDVVSCPTSKLSSG